MANLSGKELFIWLSASAVFSTRVVFSNDIFESLLKVAARWPTFLGKNCLPGFLHVLCMLPLLCVFIFFPFDAEWSF